MEKLKAYVLCIGSATILIGLLTDLCRPKTGSAFRISAGLFLALHILLPVTKMNPEMWIGYFDRLLVQGELETASGADMAAEKMEEIITQRTRAYILDKAQTYRADLNVEVELDEGQIPVPVAVTVSGRISPYGKKSMEKIIASDLGIPKERQLWIGN